MVRGKRALTIKFGVYSSCVFDNSHLTDFYTECLTFFVGNWQCKHIILGACHDGGYAPFLGRFAAEHRDRITLLCGPNAHPRFNELGFEKFLRLGSVFASHGSVVTPVTRLSVPGMLVQNAEASSGSQVHVNSAPIPERFGSVILNEFGKRLDKTLDINTDWGYFQFLRENKLCAWYYLRGKCNGCEYNHSFAPLRPGEFDALWYMCRGGLCYKVKSGRGCGDPRCIYGHEEDCQLGSGGP